MRYDIYIYIYIYIYICHWAAKHVELNTIFFHLSKDNCIYLRSVCVNRCLAQMFVYVLGSAGYHEGIW